LVCISFNYVLFEGLEYFKAFGIIAKLSFKNTQPFEQSIADAFDQFKAEGYAEKLKSFVTSDSLQSGHGDLLKFLHDQTLHIW